MSRQHRSGDGKYARKASPKLLAAAWLGSLVSVGLVLVSARLMAADIGSFRSCNHNTSVLHITTCGKQSPNVGDLVVLVFFALCALLALTVCSTTWRMTRSGGQT